MAGDAAAVAAGAVKTEPTEPVVDATAAETAAAVEGEKKTELEDEGDSGTADAVVDAEGNRPAGASLASMARIRASSSRSCSESIGSGECLPPEDW